MRVAKSLGAVCIAQSKGKEKEGSYKTMAEIRKRKLYQILYTPKPHVPKPG